MLVYEMSQPLQKLILAAALALPSIPVMAQSTTIGPKEDACFASMPKHGAGGPEWQHEWDVAHPHGCDDARRQDQADAVQKVLHPDFGFHTLTFR